MSSSTDAEAIAVAETLAAEFARSATRCVTASSEWPVQELDAFSQSGLWSLNVPKAFGGPELSYATISRMVEIISAADSSIGQISQNHIGVVAAIRTVSDEAQQKLLFAEVLKGVRFGNAFSEFGSQARGGFRDAFRRQGRSRRRQRHESSTPPARLLAHLVPIVAVDDEAAPGTPSPSAAADGLSVIDDWSAFGQRTTLSRHRHPGPCEGPEDASRSGLQGLRPPDRGRRDLPDHPGRRSTPASPRRRSTRPSSSCARRAGRGSTVGQGARL